MNQDTLDHLSAYLFWDMDRSQLDWDRDRALIIQRILEYGQIKDWLILTHQFDMNTIVEEAKHFRDLDPKALSFISTIANISRTEFRCYSERQSSPPHWNF